MKNKILGVEFKKEPNSKITYIDLGEELAAKLFPKNRKDHIYYLKKFIGGKKNLDIADEAFKDAMTKALPEDRKENCLYCQGKSTDKGSKECEWYYLQMLTTYSMAANEFVNLILHNESILKNGAFIQQLTIKFFDSFQFIKGKGLVYIDLDAILRHTLNAGFLSLSKLFSESEILNNLKLINKSLDEIDQRELQNKVLKQEDEDYLDMQKEFFEKKYKFYERELTIQKEQLGKKSESKPNKSKSIKITIPKYVLYYYYLQTTGYFPYFENHPTGKLGGIQDIIEKEGIKTSSKYFQIKYNFIANHHTNRIAKNQESNIIYVANNMLNDYPKAKKLALSELKLAQTKNR